MDRSNKATLHLTIPRPLFKLYAKDYPPITKYNIKMLKITSHLSMYGIPIDDAQIMEKTLSMFHVANIILAW